jgi:two-component system chemotaxis response regulator CheB
VNKAASPIRVLLVEDSPGQRALLVGLLNASDSFTVVGVAGNGRQAVQETLRLRPDVIAMDIHLPLMDGYEATREIMQRCPTPDCPDQRQRWREKVDRRAGSRRSDRHSQAGRAPRRS